MATTEKSTTRRTTGQTLLEGVKVVVPPVLVLGAIALALALLNLAPSRFQAGGPQQYATIEDAEMALGTQLLLPGYFPDYLAWPPTGIVGQRQPDLQADVTFVDRASRQPALWVHQELSERQEWTPTLPRPVTVVERSTQQVNGSSAWLVAYRDSEGSTYRQLYWRQDGRFLSLTAIYAQGELERMAHTMAP